MSTTLIYTALLYTGTIAATANGSTYAVVPVGADPSPGVPWDMSFEQHVTALTGTSPTVDGVVEGTAETTATSFQTLIAFTQVTTPPNAQAPVQNTLNVPPKIRYRVTIGGTTPSATIAVYARSNKPFTLVATT